MIFKQTSHLNSSVYTDALSIRETVFINEQNVDKSEEIDALENQCIHVVAYKNLIPVATARLHPKDDNVGKIQRVAVLKEFRGKKLVKHSF